MTKTPTPASHAVNTAPFAADLRGIEQEAPECPEPSPTAGMNLGERILHVGGRENAAGYIEFGSVAAVRALVAQVLRDLPARTTPAQCLHQIAEPAEYPFLPQSVGDAVDFMDGRPVDIDWSHSAPSGGTGLYTAAQMRAYVDADRAMRAAPASPAQQDALLDLLNRRPAMNAGLAQEYALWNAECYRVMGAMAKASANDAQAQQDAPAAVAAPECECCGLSPAEHDLMHWCDNQSFRHEDGTVQLGATPPAPAAVAVPAVPEIAANLPDLLPPMGIRNDRDMLNYLMGAFDNEVHYCERCGHDEAAKDMDSAGLLRDYLTAAPAQAVAVPADALERMPTVWVVVKDGAIIGTHDAPGHLDGVAAVPYRPAQEHATQLASQGQDDLRTAALQDSAYAAGMLSGWNYCIADDHATFSKVRGERMTGAVRALKEARAAAPIQAQEDAREARWLEIGKAAERACLELPEGVEIVVTLEKDAGTVTLIYEDGDEQENFPTEDGLAGVMNGAIDAARAAQGGEA